MDSIVNNIQNLLELVKAYPVSLIPIVGFILIKAYILYRRNAYRRHIQRLANKTLKNLRALDPDKDGARMFGIMRSMNHFAFEEMILTALEERGCKIKRNIRYTGDGGIDGQFWIDNHHVLVQAKRYKNHISRQHVEDFITLCKRRKCLGIFVHTGRTGKMSKAEIQAEKTIDIMSGQKILNLFLNRPITILGRKL